METFLHQLKCSTFLAGALQMSLVTDTAYGQSVSTMLSTLNGACEMLEQDDWEIESKLIDVSSSPTPTQSDVDQIFFSQISSPSQQLSAPAHAAHSQSMTWKSDEAKEKDQYARLSTLLHHFVPDSPFVPHSYAVWVKHRASMNEIEMENVKKRIATKESRNSLTVKVPIKPVLDDKTFADNRSAVLAHETIWAPWSMPTNDHPEALWPDRIEFRYEGDGRAKSDVGRFLPLPRLPGNETVNWKAREKLHPYEPLDDIGIFKVAGTTRRGLQQSDGWDQGAESQEELANILLGRELIAELG